MKKKFDIELMVYHLMYKKIVSGLSIEEVALQTENEIDEINEANLGERKPLPGKRGYWGNSKIEKLHRGMHQDIQDGLYEL